MCLILCDICDVNITSDMFNNVEHVCKREDIEKNVKKLTETMNFYHGKLINAEELLNCYISKKMEIREDERVFLDKMMKILSPGLASFSSETSESFLVKWIATHSVLCEAFQLFYKDGRPILEKLKDLEDSIANARQVLKYKTSKDVMTSEELCLKSI